MSMSMAASHAVNRTLYDPIFIANGACKDAIKIHGKDNVTNATIGVVLDEDGKLAVLPTVEFDGLCKLRGTSRQCRIYRRR